MSFVQIIEYRSSKPDEINTLMDEWIAATEGTRTPDRSVVAGDRDNPGTYLQIVEFPSYEAAMRNNEMDQTSAFASRMMALCDGEPIFRNLDVLRDEKL